VLVVSLWVILVNAQGEENPIEVIAPRPSAVYGWGRQAPTVQLKVRARFAEPTRRVFVTAILYSHRGELIQRVPLRDDGQFGDAVADDRVFVGEYIPHAPQIYRIRFKMEWQYNGISKQHYSPFHSFEVVRVPYARFRDKLKQSQAHVGAATRQTVVLLIGDSEKRYTGSMDGIVIQAYAEPKAHVELSEPPAPENSITYRFEKPGHYTLYVRTVLNYKGQQIATEPDMMSVAYTQPSRWLLYAPLIALLAFILLPPRQIPLYRHFLSLRDRRLDLTYEVEVAGDESISIGPQGSDHPILGYEGEAIELQARPGEDRVFLIAGELRNATGTQEVVPLNSPLMPEQEYLIGNIAVLEYKEVLRNGSKRGSRLMPNTVLKMLALAVALLVAALYFYQQHQLQQLAQL